MQLQRYFPNFEETIEFVMNAHGYQKYGPNLPYVTHLVLVARHFDDWLGRSAALLHDVCEDTSVEINTIFDRWGPTVADAVAALTHLKREDYLKAYIPRLARNELAVRVKMADLQENIYSAENYYPAYAYLLPKYRKALAYLVEHGERG